MTAISRMLERVALAVLLLGGIGLLMAMFLGVADIVGTQVLLVPVPGPYEITESSMVLIVFGALCYAQIKRAHIRVELVHAWMPPRVQAGMDVVADLAALLFFGLLLWQAVLEAQYSIRIDEKTVGLIRMPLWPARIVLAVGTGLLILRLLIDLAIDLGRVRTGAPPPTASSAEST